MTLIGDKGFSDDDEERSLEIESESSDSSSHGQRVSNHTAVTEDAEKLVGTEDVVQHSFYEDIDQFDFKDVEIGDIGAISKSKLVQGALDGFISVKEASARLRRKVSSERMHNLMARLEKRRQKIERTM